MENLVYSYTPDGIFVDITEVANKNGFKIPVAVTTNLFSSFIKSANEDQKQADKTTKQNLNHLLHAVREEIKNYRDNRMISTNICFEGQTIPTTIWAVMEAQSPTDPSPAINILLPEDY